MEQVQSIVVPTPNTQDPKDPLQTSRGHHNWATGVNVCLQLMTIDDYFCKQKKLLLKYWDLHTSFFRVSCTYMSSVSIWGGEGCSLRVAAVTNNCDLFQSISLKLLTKKNTWWQMNKNRMRNNSPCHQIWSIHWRGCWAAGDTAPVAMKGWTWYLLSAACL